MAAASSAILQNFRATTYETLTLAKRGDRFAQNRLMSAALGLSLLLHSILLAVRFVAADDKRPAVSPPLEVVLVNSKSASKPYKAELLAQHNLDGGGNTDAKRRAKSPLPVLPKENEGTELSVATQRQQELEQQAQQLLAQASAPSTVMLQPRRTDAADPMQLPTAQEMMQRTLEAIRLETIRLEAQIARDMEAYQQRPKRRFLGARAEEYRFARYVEDWRGKVERIGNLNYPEAARSQRLYGDLLLTVAIRADGSVESVEINRSSGKKILDAAAVRIVQLAAPYAGFPPDIRRDTDIIHITRTWTFTRGDELIAN
jgi:protein TonB